MTEKYLVSIIMPAYNVESYISDAIRSVLNQTYNNWELIIVNDGSTDKTKEICESFAEKDNRIIVISQENQHQGPARNNGFSKSHGDFVYFADSDDIIHPQCFEILLDLYARTEYDLINFNFISFLRNNSFSHHQITLLPRISYIPVHRAILELSQAPWRFFFTRALLYKSGVDFPSYFHEDDAEMYRIFSYAEKIATTNEVLYYYRRRPESTMGLTCNPHTVDTLKVVRRFIYIADKRPDFHDVFYAKAESLIKLRIHDWKKIDEPWAKNAIVQGEQFLSEIEDKNKDNPYIFISESVSSIYENSLSWKITKPLRRLKKILRKF